MSGPFHFTEATREGYISLKTRGRQPVLPMRWKLVGDTLAGEAKDELRKKRRNSEVLTLTKGRKGSCPGRVSPGKRTGEKCSGFKFSLLEPRCKGVNKGQRESIYHCLSKPAFFWELN